MKHLMERILWLAAILLGVFFETHLIADLGGKERSEAQSSLTFSAEALYFKMQEGGMAYGILNRGLDPLIVPVTTVEAKFDAKVKGPRFPWKWGWRLEGSYLLCEGCLKGFVSWFYFNGRGDDHLEVCKSDEYFVGTWSQNTLGFLGPFFIPSASTTTLRKEQTIDAHLNSCLNFVDLGLTYHTQSLKCLQIDPQIALRIGSIRQKYQISCGLIGELIEGERVTDVMEILVHQKITLNNRFCAVGVLGGVQCCYQCSSWCHLLAKVRGALLKGDFTLSQTNIAEAISNTEEFGEMMISQDLHQSDHFDALRPYLEVGVALQWKVTLYRHCLPVILQVGWEQQSYYGQNQLQPFSYALFKGQLGVKQADRGDLRLQGWTFSAMVEF